EALQQRAVGAVGLDDVAQLHRLDPELARAAADLGRRAGRVGQVGAQRPHEQVDRLAPAPEQRLELLAVVRGPDVDHDLLEDPRVDPLRAARPLAGHHPAAALAAGRHATRAPAQLARPVAPPARAGALALARAAAEVLALGEPVAQQLLDVPPVVVVERLRLGR